MPGVPYFLSCSDMTAPDMSELPVPAPDTPLPALVKTCLIPSSLLTGFTVPSPPLRILNVLEFGLRPRVPCSTLYLVPPALLIDAAVYVVTDITVPSTVLSSVCPPVRSV